MIKVNHLEKYFNRRQKNEIHVLNDISVEFPEKGLVVLLGASGSGKTTLLNVLGGLDKVQSGVIDFGDESISRYDAATWDKIRNENVGYVFQNYNLLPDLSVYDNIAFVLKMIGITDPEIIEQRVLYILNAVNMYPFRKKKALQLSGGQQQRVAIARALVKNPKVIIADEPTGNLDSKNTLDIMNIIKQISLEKLVVLVTHEKDIAKFYGDRIIEIVDGQITKDYENGETENHKISKDDTIYLKDLNTVTEFEDKNIKVELYNDHDEISEPINIRLIIKNKTLYLDVDSTYNKINLVDDSSGVIIKNENYVRKSRKEMIETTFDLDMLDNKDINRQTSAIVSLKSTFKMAFRKILTTTRKGKLMLFSFLVAGMVISITIAMLAAVVVVKPEPYMNLSKGYVQVEKASAVVLPTYDELMTYKPVDDDSYFIHVYSGANLSFINPNGTSSQVRVNGQIDLVDFVKSRDLVAGRLPEIADEIMISSAIADNLVKNSSGQEIGIWSYQHIFYENLKISDHDIKIVGIVDTEISLIYMSREMADLYTVINSGIGPFPVSKTFYSDTDLVAGTMPETGQVVISETYYFSLTGGNDYTGAWPQTLLTLDYPVSGVHDITDGAIILLANSADIEKMIYGDDPWITRIYSRDPASLITELEDSISTIRVTDIYQDAYDSAQSMQQVVLWSTLGTSGVLIGFAMLGFYFVIRSSLISRIYEVSVYRALGVKKNDIFRSFVVEIFVLTSMSTLLGYILATLALSKLQDGLFGDFNFFLVTPITIILGLILAYILNMLAGLFPVFMLLKKTPAQILSQYDI